MHTLPFAGVLLLLMAVLGVGTVRSGLLLRGWVPDRNLLLGPADNLLRLLLIGLCVATGWLLGPGPEALGWTRFDPGFGVVAGVGAGMALALALALLGWVVVRRWGASMHSDKMLRCILPVNGREWVGVVLALLPAAALEELLFRSLPLAGLAGWVSPWVMLWPLALCFGLLHWPQGWWGVAGTTVAAVVLSVLFLATGSFWIALLAHYIVNLIQLMLAYLSGIRPLRAI